MANHRLAQIDESGIKTGTSPVGSRLKTGNVVVTEDSFAAVVFGTAFAAIPNVTVSPISDDTDHQATAANITVNGFDCYMNKSGGGAAGEITVGWVASDIGNA
jgi:hypothetical protein